MISTTSFSSRRKFQDKVTTQHYRVSNDAKGYYFNFAHGGRDLNTHQHMPKLDFPRFDEDNSRKWIQKCNHYFLLHNIRDETQRVTMSAMHLDAKADRRLLNLQSYKSIGSCLSFHNRLVFDLRILVVII